MPVVAAQAVWVRRRVPRLPEAAGPRSGEVQPPTTAQPAAAAQAHPGGPVQVGVVGDSTAAGCGAPTQEEAFGVAFARALAALAGRPVHWQVAGANGATAHLVRTRMLEQLPQHLDVVVVLVGVNDVLQRRSTADWSAQMGALVADLADRARHVLVAGIPDFTVFPALPGLLGRYLGARAAALDEITRGLVAARPDCTWVDSASAIPDDPAFFAVDGFHPGPDGYRYWADHVAAHLPGHLPGVTSRND